jgi:hypothetical protein
MHGVLSNVYLCQKKFQLVENYQLETILGAVI